MINRELKTCKSRVNKHSLHHHKGNQWSVVPIGWCDIYSAFSCCAITFLCVIILCRTKWVFWIGKNNALSPRVVVFSSITKKCQPSNFHHQTSTSFSTANFNLTYLVSFCNLYSATSQTHWAGTKRARRRDKSRKV